MKKNRTAINDSHRLHSPIGSIDRLGVDVDSRVDEMNNTAERELAHLNECGYRQVAVVMVGPKGCAVVSELGRVTWHSEEFESRVTGAEPKCGCTRCLTERVAVTDYGWPVTATRMLVCEHCGNKRCPHANDHRNDCTNSNEPGQIGGGHS